MELINYYSNKSLLSSGKSNTKIAKNLKETYYLSLQPASNNSKSVNLCRFSTKECREHCLQYSGRQIFSNVVKSRSNKTEFFINHKKEFIEKLWNELVELNKKGNCAVRLNALSDVDWYNEFINKGLDISKLNNIQFYDYTKDHFKLLSNTCKNYHFTFSYTGHNWVVAKKILDERKANVAVVFKEVPSEWNGYKVINGDLTDERFLDEEGVIVGLKYKKARGILINSKKFVI